MSYKIKIEKNSVSKIHEVDFNNIPFGRVFSDHMFVVDFIDGAWKDPRIIPFQNLSMHPSTSALHYGQAIFEGLKAYKDHSGNIQIFRPEKNIQRMNRSAERMAMPQISEELFLNAMTELIKLDQEWIPTSEGASLYIRPFMFATDEYVGIKASENYKFVIFTCPVQAYYSQPVKVKIAEKYVRAFPGGTGTAKAAGNYAGTLYPVNLAKQEGYDQILWMDAKEFKYLQEIGTMNIFIQIGDKIITPDLSQGTILEGITRDSVLQLLHDWDIEVEERRITIDEVVEAYNKNELKDAFGTGTAATISHISNIGYKNKNLILPDPESRIISNRIKDELNKIKLSRAEDKYNWMYKINLEATV
ncbi:MAG: branched-chain amino acid aminotransferase [Chitinophagales bacterium]